MSQYLEFVGNHPFLSAAAVILIAVTVMYELKRATRRYADIEPGDATRLINHDDALMIDTRPSAEFDKRHILNAMSVPAAELGDRLPKLDKQAERPVIVYCAAGTTSGGVADALTQAGFKRVYNLKGGIAAWETAGLPVIKGRK